MKKLFVNAIVSDMYYIVALGNPGTQYVGTRHNVGFAVADAFALATALEAPRPSSRYCGLLTEGVIGGETVTVLWPDTYMNHSGDAAAALVPKDKISQLIVVHDEVALPLGKVRISKGSGAAGHNGVSSIIDALGTSDFIRVRLGVGAALSPIPLERFVLQRFSVEELPVVATMTDVGVEAMQLIVKKGVEAAMTHINGQQ